MEQKIQQQINLIQSKHFIISDEEKAKWYLKQVWAYRLWRYFNVFKTEIENQEKIDFQKIIDCYVFDKQLRTHCIGILEAIEVFLKNLLILYISDEYTNIDLYIEKYNLKRMEFIYSKIFSIAQRNENMKNILENKQKIPAKIFFDDFSFWEAVRFLNDIKPRHKNTIIKEFWIGLPILENWLGWMVYLRNLCSHSENIFNKKMKYTLKGNFFDNTFWTENDNKFISYLVVLQIFKKSLIPNYKWEEELKMLMEKYQIRTEKFSDKKITPLCEHNQNNIEFWTEAWEVFVCTIYTKYIKKSSHFI